MPWMSIGSMLGGAGSLLGGLGIGSKGPSAKKQIGMMEAQARVSRDDIPLRAAAYKAAGIHPLYGMAGQQFQPTPTSMSGDSGIDFASAGQGIQRAMSAYQTKSERAFSSASQALQLERMQLENDILRSQATSIHHSTVPSLPGGISPAVDGQGDAFFTSPAGIGEIEPSRSISGAVGRTGVEAGVSPLVKNYSTGGRGPLYLPSEQASEALEGLPFPVSTIAGADILVRGIAPEYWRDFKRTDFYQTRRNIIRELYRRWKRR